MTRAVDAVHAGGEWIRHAPHRSDLLSRAATPTDGRWQHGAVVPGLYLAEDAATAVAEWYRFLAELGIPPGRAVPHDHHVWRLSLELADLSSTRQLDSIGLQPPRPGRATWSPDQDIGRLRADRVLGAGRSPRLNIPITPDLHAHASERARREGKSLSQLARDALEQHVTK